jgi:hypothetical protein
MMIVLLGGQFMALLDITIVNVALRTWRLGSPFLRVGVSAVLRPKHSIFKDLDGDTEAPLLPTCPD